MDWIFFFSLDESILANAAKGVDPSSVAFGAFSALTNPSFTRGVLLSHHSCSGPFHFCIGD